MIITDRLGFIAHPNTGTRSIRKALESIGGREIGGYHEVHAPSLDGRINFCTMRNPWDLMVSWFYRTTGGKGHCFHEWLPATLKGLRHYEGPGKGLFYGIRDSHMVLKFENLQSGFDAVMRFVGEEPIKLDHVGRTDRPRDYRALYYNASLVDMVERAYFKQIAHGGYSF